MTRRRFSARDLTTRLLEFNGKCADCSCKTGGSNGLEWDHIIPLMLGGDDELENLQPLCKACHRAKTKTDQGHIAKSKRMQQRAMGVKKQPKGRGFRGWRRFDGTIVWAD
ncbi:MAG: HNH endonuclease signature motif containing protein [Pseudomonadota bacterium]